CILSERDFAHGDLLVMARPIGGLRMIDRGQADDKIIAVLDQDVAYGGFTDIDQCPESIITRLKHYFLSYKSPPTNGRPKRVVQIQKVYNRKEAMEVIRRSLADYKESYGSQESRLAKLRALLTASVK
ncbi:MAG: inorganic diphosphatase, partial [Candidatus Obscuribacterales bacterium]|nr:inorganic diphosphatase [Candidatus Obscuribacterales bacterium]